MKGFQGLLWTPPSSWEAPQLDSLPRWSEAKRIAIDLETCDPDLSTRGPGVRRGAYIVGVGFAIEDGPAYYLPIAHLGGDNLDRDKVLAYIREQALSFGGDVVGTNLTYDLDFLAEVGIYFPKVRWFRDVQVAEPLLDELQERYSLEHIAIRYGLTGKSQAKMLEAAQAFGLKGRLGSSIWQLPARYVAEYAIQDCCLPLQLLRRQERKIEEEELWDIYNLESALLPVLLRMRRRGVRFSHTKLDQVDEWSRREEQAALNEVHAHTGVRIKLGDVWATGPFEQALNAIGITCSLTPKGNTSVTADFLDSIDHPAAKAMARARKVNKIRTTFAASIRNYAIGDRIHCVLNQMRREKDEGGLAGAAYGRLSSEHPNLQQQPARDPEIGPMWRSIYIPDEGGIWASCDYSQQECRLLTHYAELTGCRGAREAGDQYRRDPKTDNHAMMAQLTGLPRKDAKNIYFGICYGMGGAKLAADVGLSTVKKFSARLGREIEVAGPQAQAILDTFDQRAPFVRQLAKKCEDKVKERGWIKTIGGRMCRFPRNEKGEYDWTHKAVNRLIQGSAADQTKAAMVAADKAGIPLALQVHDELDLTVPSVEAAQALAEIMRDVVQLLVPVLVDVETGPNWGEISK